MTDTNLIREQVKEAREMVGKATPGRRTIQVVTVEDGEPVWGVNAETFDVLRRAHSEDDAWLYYSAPSLITSLCDLVEELIEEKEK